MRKEEGQLKKGGEKVEGGFGNNKKVALSHGSEGDLFL